MILTLTEVDTFAEVSINGKSVLKAENQFRCWKVDVKPFLTEGKNEIEIKISPPFVEADALAAASPRIVPGTKNSLFKNLNHIRKTQCHAGWDWGVCLVTAGVYGELSLEAIDIGQIDHVMTEQVHNDHGVEVIVDTEITGYKKGDFSIEMNF